MLRHADRQTDRQAASQSDTQVLLLFQEGRGLGIGMEMEMLKQQLKAKVADAHAFFLARKSREAGGVRWLRVFWAEKEAANKLQPPNDSCGGTIATTRAFPQ